MTAKLIALIKDHWVYLIAAIFIVTPIAAGIAKYFYQERIASKDALIELLKEQKAHLDSRLEELSVAFELISNKTNIAQSNGNDVNSILVAGVPTLPTVKNENELSKQEVRAFASFYGLLDRTKINPHLRFKDGDISYWHEQSLTEKELRIEFETRQTVLDRAEKSREKIPSQGDLSFRAEELQSMLRQQ